MVIMATCQVCLVMELAKGGELFDRLLEAGSLDEREAGRVMSQVGSSGLLVVGITYEKQFPPLPPILF